VDRRLSSIHRCTNKYLSNIDGEMYRKRQAQNNLNSCLEIKESDLSNERQLKLKYFIKSAGIIRNEKVAL
jgi:hypothetical protein